MVLLWDAAGQPISVAAVEGLGENAGDGRFADATVAGEDVAVGDPVLIERVNQRSGYVILACDVRKTLRTIFSRQYLIAHRPPALLQGL